MAFVVDCLASALIAGLFTVSFAGHSRAHALPGSWSLIPFALDYIVGLPLTGRTLGMNLVGIRVVRVDRPTRITVLDAIVRTIALVVLIPALIWDSDGRGSTRSTGPNRRRSRPDPVRVRCPKRCRNQTDLSSLAAINLDPGRA